MKENLWLPKYERELRDAPGEKRVGVTVPPDAGQQPPAGVSCPSELERARSAREAAVREGVPYSVRDEGWYGLHDRFGVLLNRIKGWTE